MNLKKKKIIFFLHLPQSKKARTKECPCYSASEDKLFVCSNAADESGEMSSWGALCCRPAHVKDPMEWRTVSLPQQKSVEIPPAVGMR